MVALGQEEAWKSNGFPKALVSRTWGQIPCTRAVGLRISGSGMRSQGGTRESWTPSPRLGSRRQAGALRSRSHRRWAERACCSGQALGVAAGLLHLPGALQGAGDAALRPQLLWGLHPGLVGPPQEGVPRVPRALPGLRRAASQRGSERGGGGAARHARPRPRPRPRPSQRCLNPLLALTPARTPSSMWWAHPSRPIRGSGGNRPPAPLL